MAKQENEYFDIHVRAHLVDAAKADKVPEASAYAFSSEGRLLAAAPVDAKGAATLKVPVTASVAQLRVLVGPRIEKDMADFSDLIRRGAQEKHLRVDSRTSRFDLELTIYPDIWRCWLLGLCFVRGTLNKRVLVGGKYENYPVCNATVEVYEVDPIWIIIPKLPDLVLNRLRDIIVDPRPIPLPIPEPGPDPEPFARAAMLQSTAEFDHRLDADSAMTLRQLAGATDLRYAAQLGSKQQFQQALIDHAKLIRPLLCLFYPLLITKHLVATAKTDECGHFQTLFFKGCHNHDTPDLYFKAKQKLFGFLDVYIYAPTPVACYTWWDYACGTEVTLYTSSPWAQTCSPCPPVTGPAGKDRWVAFLSIGAHGLNNIFGTAPDLAGTTTPANIGLTQGGAPWGSMLLPRLLFSNGLEATGARYYQVSWRKGSSGSFLPLIGRVDHYYRHDVNTPSGPMPAWTPMKLGPESVSDGAGHEIPNLFKIPYPSVAPAGVWDVPPDIHEIKEHFASAKFPTQEIAPGMIYNDDGTLKPTPADTSGKYQLKVDLFNATGQPVNIGPLGIVYAVPTDPDGTGTINTVDASTLGLVSGNSMIITLHVDNNPTFAGIDAPTIAAATADPCCGVLKYNAGDSVTMGWQALHPHNFATYSFGVVRGTQSVISESGPVAASTSPKVQTVSHLLNDNLPAGCPVDGCSVAGFSENLHVYGTASDGWGADLYNTSDVRAFVLAKA
jgi:hypothetical protein